MLTLKVATPSGLVERPISLGRLALIGSLPASIAALFRFIKVVIANCQAPSSQTPLFSPPKLPLPPVAKLLGEISGLVAPKQKPFINSPLELEAPGQSDVVPIELSEAGIVKSVDIKLVF